GRHSGLRAEPDKPCAGDEHGFDPVLHAESNELNRPDYEFLSWPADYRGNANGDQHRCGTGGHDTTGVPERVYELFRAADPDEHRSEHFQQPDPHHSPGCVVAAIPEPEHSHDEHDREPATANREHHFDEWSAGSMGQP